MTSPDQPPSGVSHELLAELFDAHAPRLELFATQWSGTAADCVQEAFIQLARQPSPPDDPLAWLYRVVRNRAMNMARSERRRRHHEAAQSQRRQPWFTPRSGDLLDTKELTSALESLADQDREVIVARIWGGLTFAQIARVLGTSTTSAYRRYATGIDVLRRRLETTWPAEKTCQTE